MIKLIRRIEDGTNPELEIGGFLTDEAAFAHSPPVIGSLELRRDVARNGSDPEPGTIAVVTELVPHDDDAWTSTADELARFFDRAIGSGEKRPDPVRCADLLGVAPTDAARLGARTAELHLALASGSGEAFRPERLGRHDRRSLAQSIRTQVSGSMTALRQARRRLDPVVDAMAASVLADHATLTGALTGLIDVADAGQRQRVHGDLHLGQVLVAGDRYVFIDFEGEPARPISQRRIKRPALVDVAGMLRSYDYAAAVAARTVIQRGSLHGWSLDDLADWADWWSTAMSDAFVGAYREHIEGSGLVPDGEGAFDLLLRCCLVEKAAYELRYELDHRPDWVSIPLRGILRLERAISDDASSGSANSSSANSGKD